MQRISLPKELKYQKYIEIKAFFDVLLNEGELSSELISPFWGMILKDRKNFLTFNEMAVFRRGAATGVGYGKKMDEDLEYLNFMLNLGRTREIAPIDYIKDNLESDIGQPYQFFKDGIISSPAGLGNIAKAYRIETVLKECGSKSTGCILEIGAGYGGLAEILIKNLNPGKYIICDLPHNLFLSAYYLSVNYPEYKIHFVDNTAPTDISDFSLVFATPRGLELLSERVDLVINTYSFQEMILSEVVRYFNYIEKNLDENGLFYFLNHHGAAGVQKPSEYPFHLFSIKAFSPLPSSLLSFLGRKLPYEVILKKRGRQDKIHRDFMETADTISSLIFMGLDKNIADFCRRLVSSDVEEREIEYFASINKEVTSGSVKEALMGADLLKDYTDQLHITLYISGLLRLFDNDLSRAEDDLNRSISAGLLGLAKTRALFGLSLLSRRKGDFKKAESYMRDAVENSPQYTVELERDFESISIDRFKDAYRYAFPGFDLKPKGGPMVKRAIVALIGLSRKILKTSDSGV